MPGSSFIFTTRNILLFPISPLPPYTTADENNEIKYFCVFHSSRRRKLMLTNVFIYNENISVYSGKSNNGSLLLGLLDIRPVRFRGSSEYFASSSLHLPRLMRQIYPRLMVLPGDITRVIWRFSSGFSLSVFLLLPIYFFFCMKRVVHRPAAVLILRTRTEKKPIFGRTVNINDDKNIKRSPMFSKVMFFYREIF